MSSVWVTLQLLLPFLHLREIFYRLQTSSLSPLTPAVTVIYNVRGTFFSLKLTLSHCFQLTKYERASRTTEFLILEVLILTNGSILEKET